MAKLNDIVKFLDSYLKIKEIKDDSWNGLQVEGKENVNKVIFAENACLDVFKKAVTAKGDMIVVHHGHFWGRQNPSVKGWKKERIELLLKNGVSLYGVHLPLDAHKEVGNNAQLLKILGAGRKKEFGKHDDNFISWQGEFKKPVSAEEVVKKVNQKLGTKCKTLLFGPKRVKTFAVCSGGGGYGVFFEAFNKKIDLYLTGDTIEAYTVAKDAKFNVIFAGHYATETVGVKALMEIVKKRFKVNTQFIDDPTGL